MFSLLSLSQRVKWISAFVNNSNKWQQWMPSKSVGLVWGLARSLKSLHEPSELSQQPSHDDSTVNMVKHIIIFTVSTWPSTDHSGCCCQPVVPCKPKTTLCICWASEYLSVRGQAELNTSLCKVKIKWVPLCARSSWSSCLFASRSFKKLNSTLRVFSSLDSNNCPQTHHATRLIHSIPMMVAWLSGNALVSIKHSTPHVSYTQYRWW